MLTTSPLLGSSARASVFGSDTSTPPCMRGAVIMKMTSRSIITSMSDTTLMSALSGVRSPCVRRRMLDAPLAGHQRDDLRTEAFEFAVESIEPGGEDVVREHRRDGDGQCGGCGHERLGDAGRHRPEVARPLRRNAEEGVDDAEDRPEQADQRAGRANHRERRNETP